MGSLPTESHSESMAMETFAEAVRSAATLPADQVRGIAREAVRRMTREEAAMALRVLWHESERPNSRAYKVMALCGSLVSQLEDAANLPPDRRRAKWDVEAAEAQSECGKHVAHQTRLLARREKRWKNVARNMQLLPERMKRGLVQSWVAECDDRLMSMPPTFWSAVRLSWDDEVDTRCALARIDALALDFGRARFPVSLWCRYERILDDLPYPQPARCTWTSIASASKARKPFGRRWTRQKKGGVA